MESFCIMRVALPLMFWHCPSKRVLQHTHTNNALFLFVIIGCCGACDKFGVDYPYACRWTSVFMHRIFCRPHTFGVGFTALPIQCSMVSAPTPHIAFVAMVLMLLHATFVFVIPWVFFSLFNSTGFNNAN